MKILAIADTHLGFQVGRTAEARKFISENTFSAFSNIMEIAIEKKYDFVLHGGDVFNRSSPDSKEVQKFYTKVERVLDEGIGFVMVPGNHDRAHLPDSLLKFYYNKFYCFNKFSQFSLGDISVIGFPFEYNDPKAVFNKITKIAEKNPKQLYLVLCHQLFYGAVFGPHNFRFTLQNDVIYPKNLPENLKLIITGHIHRAQSLSKGRVVYPGSTERTHHFEIIEPKGYLEIDINHDFIKIKFNEIPTTEIKVLEYNIQNDRIPFNLIDNDLGSPRCRTLVRFFGRQLDSEEIKACYTRYNAKNWPLLSFSPNKNNRTLRQLYSNYDSEFIFQNKLVKTSVLF
ncbi:MAG: hypothetical protein GPJ54_05470 [Candidatus Heimdallarchaeota archaeon]|nr:hypothetical protein [Candidatus Heimdallarchaeota archaeon]